jgi:hypothetical protein
MIIATLQLGGQRLTMDHLNNWSSADAAIADRANDLEITLPHRYEPAGTYGHAKRIADALGATVIDPKPEPIKIVLADLVY